VNLYSLFVYIENNGDKSPKGYYTDVLCLGNPELSFQVTKQHESYQGTAEIASAAGKHLVFSTIFRQSKSFFLYLRYRWNKQR
jgi:hypothetical protein